MKIFKRIGLTISVLLILFLLFNYKLVSYGLAQLKGQVHIISNALPINEALLDDNYSAEEKTKLLLISEIKQFAIDSLGLNDSKSYQSIYNQNNEPILWTITGCEPYELKAYEWGFPFLGKVPYKGFFDYKKGETEADALRQIGYDVDYSSVSGWSTLGWFGDPLLSNMLKRKEGSLAELIIHELTHATIYIKDKADYNENLATFIGVKGAEAFLKSKYNKTSKQYLEYTNYQKDKEKYIQHILNGAIQLDSLYNSIEHIDDTVVKRELKTKLISEIISNIDTITFQKPNRYTWNIDKKPLPNNTFFMSFLRYRKKQSDFNSQLESVFNGNIENFIHEINRQK